MLGNYALQDMPKSVIKDIGFFKFPLIGKTSGYQEEAPLDILVIPTQAKNVALAKRFLTFVADRNNQTQLANTLGVLSPNQHAQVGNSPLVQEAYEALSQADGISQFFDRDSHKVLADTAMPHIDDFFVSTDVKATLQALEKARISFIAKD
jgi:multiple sugar transport system substrate-binding protein